MITSVPSWLNKKKLEIDYSYHLSARVSQLVRTTVLGIRTCVYSQIIRMHFNIIHVIYQPNRRYDNEFLLGFVTAFLSVFVSKRELCLAIIKKCSCQMMINSSVFFALSFLQLCRIPFKFCCKSLANPKAFEGLGHSSFCLSSDSLVSLHRKMSDVPQLIQLILTHTHTRSPM